jgi:hypothetical protein
MESAIHASRVRSCARTYPILHCSTESHVAKTTSLVGLAGREPEPHTASLMRAWWGGEERYDVRHGARGRSAAKDVVT